MLQHQHMVDQLCSRIDSLRLRFSDRPRQRVLVALAGVPGSGKSTISTAVLAGLRARGEEGVMVIPMDGFHYSKAVLSTFSDAEEAFKRRGAPFTYDFDGFLTLVQTLKTVPVTPPHEPDTAIMAPSFDHVVQDPVPDDISVSSKTSIVIVEGNYTLLSKDPWDKLADVFDDRWFVDVPADVAHQRLIQRHILAGIETSREAAAVRAEQNDLPNGKLIRDNLVQPTVWISGSTPESGKEMVRIV